MTEAFDIVGAGWWRFTRYELRDGYIRPAPGATLEEYDPWESYRKAWDKQAYLDDRDAIGRPYPKWREEQVPYYSLLALLKDKESIRISDRGSLHYFHFATGSIHFDLTPRGETALLDWCAQHGLLGVLPQEAHAVFLMPRMRPVPATFKLTGVDWQDAVWQSQEFFIGLTLDGRNRFDKSRRTVESGETIWS